MDASAPLWGAQAYTVEEEEGSGDVVRGLYDSGATHHISNDKKFFSWVAPCSELGLQVATHESIPAYKAKFRKNSLGLSAGLFVPALGPRLLLSMSEFEDDGYEVHVGKGKRELIDSGGATHQLHRSGKLYRVEVEFFDQKTLKRQRETVGEADFDEGDHVVSKKRKTMAYSTKDETEAGDGSGNELVDSHPFKKLTALERLRIHERNAHFHVPGLRIPFCPACAVQKNYGVEGHKEKRPEEMLPKAFNDQIDADFVGPFEPLEKGKTSFFTDEPFSSSLSGHRWRLVIISIKILPEVGP